MISKNFPNTFFIEFCTNYRDRVVDFSTFMEYTTALRMGNS